MQPQDHRVRVGAERSARMRARLLEGALAAMSEKAPEAVQVEDVTRAAGVSRGAFYNHFNSPAEAARAVGLALAEELIANTQKSLEGVTDPAARLAKGLRAVIAFARAHPERGAFIARAGWPMTDPVEAFSRHVLRDLAAGMESGRFQRMSMTTAGTLAAGLAIGAIGAVVEGQAPPDFEMEAAGALLRALGISDAEARAFAAG